MELPNNQRNLYTNFARIQPDAGSSNGVIKLYNDETKAILGVTIPLNDPAYTASNIEGFAGAILQPQIMGRSWLDVSTTILLGLPVVAITVTYGEILDSNGVINQAGYVSIDAGSFIQITTVDLSTSVQVQCINGFIETLKGSK